MENAKQILQREADSLTSEARDGLLSICAALNLLLQQVFCRPVDVHTEPSGYRLITVNEIHNSGFRNLKTHTQQKYTTKWGEKSPVAPAKLL